MSSSDPTAAASGDADSRRRCPSCSAGFTPHPRKPSQRYCSERCRHAGHRRRHRDQRVRTSSPSPLASSSLSRGTAGVNEELGAPGRDQGEHRRRSHGDAPLPINNDDEVNEASTRVGDEVHDVAHCPHCGQPIALVTLLLTRTAAHVTVPELPAAHRQRHGRN